MLQRAFISARWLLLWLWLQYTLSLPSPYSSRENRVSKVSGKSNNKKPKTRCRNGKMRLRTWQQCWWDLQSLSDCIQVWRLCTFEQELERQPQSTFMFVDLDILSHISGVSVQPASYACHKQTINICIKTKLLFSLNRSLDFSMTVAQCSAGSLGEVIWEYVAEGRLAGMCFIYFPQQHGVNIGEATNYKQEINTWKIPFDDTIHIFAYHIYLYTWSCMHVYACAWKRVHAYTQCRNEDYYARSPHSRIESEKRQ